MLLDNTSYMYTINGFISQISAYVLIFVTFWGSRRIKKSLVVLVFCLYPIVYMAGFYLITEYLADDADGRIFLSGLFSVVFNISYIFGALACFRVRLVKLCYISFTAFSIYTFINSLSRVLVSWLHPGMDDVWTSWQYGVVLLITVAVFMPYAAYFFTYHIREALSELSARSIALLSAVPVLFYLFFVGFIQTAAAPIVQRYASLFVVIDVIGIIAILVNILITLNVTQTVRLSAQSEIAESQLVAENAMLSRMNHLINRYLSDVSHEMKTPLTIMAGYAELTQWQLKAGIVNEETDKHLVVISEESHRLSQFVEQLLDVSANSKIGIEKAEIFVSDIMSKVEQLCTPLLIVNNNLLSIRVEEGCPPVAASSNMILQVFINLLSNANRHTKYDVISIEAVPEEKHVCFRVKDNGTGVPKKALANIFQRGVSGSGRTGLGLSICKDAVEAHGGTMQAESEPGKGTCISFTLPKYEK